MQPRHGLFHTLRPVILTGLLAFAQRLPAAAPTPTPDPDAFADPELEVIPPPPGLTRSAQAAAAGLTASAAARPAAAPASASADGLTGSAGTGGALSASAGVGGLKLPADLKLPPPSAGGLSAPGYLTAIAGNRSVLLSWYGSEGPKPLSGYLIFRGLAADAIPPQPINKVPVTETNFSDTDLNSTEGPQNRRAYYYKVRAFDTDGRLSPYSDLVSATPSGPLLPPGKLSAAGFDGKVLLQWSAPISTGDAELAGLRLLRGTASGSLNPYRDLKPDTLSFEDTGLANGKALYYAVQSIDSLGNTSAPSAEVRGLPFRALPAPSGLSALGVGDEAVRLKWVAPAETGSFAVKGYNIYRSTGASIDLSSPPINKSLVPAGRTRFEDGPEDSVEAPKKGTDYHYQVVAVDEEGNPSPASGPSVAGPVASLTKLETGEIQIGSEKNTLQISGRKTIDASYTWVAQDQNQALGTGALGGFQLDQQLQVRLTGKVGRKIKVDVDYDDKAQANQQQKISVVYTGDQQEVFKEFAFGDILMDLNSSRTEFAGYNKSLFGAKLKLVSPDERLRITAVGAQTKGITESKRIIGGYEQARTNNVLGEDKQDLVFQPFKYYFLSRDKDLVEGPDYIIPGSVDIWLDQPGVTIYSAGRVEVVDKNNTGRFYFVRLVPNVDYTVDSSSGLVTFNHGIGARDNIAVAYRVQKSNGTQVSVGYDGSGNFDFSSANMDSDKNTGKTTNDKKLIQYGLAYGGQQYDSHMSMQFYKLNGRDILNPQLDPDFKLKIYQGQSVFYELDTRSNFSDVVDFDTRLGWMRFRVPFPFKAGNSKADLVMDPGFNAVEKVFAPDQADAYTLGTNRTNNFTVHIEYKYKVASYSLRFGIIKGSEVILLDGRRLARDVDYFLDYDTGSLVFSNPDLVKENSVVDATYEYLPFGGQFTSTIWGTRGEYDITKDISVGSTFLWNSADAPTDVPDVRSSPYSLQILDGDLQAAVPQTLLDGITSHLPLLPDRDGLLTVKARGEMARSWYRPNTYGRNNESGVAMIDNFEAVDNITSASMDRTSWYPSSIPLRFNGDSGMLPADRRFTRFTTVQERAHDATQRVQNNENPNRSMAQIEWSNFDTPNAWDAYVYSFGVNTPDAIKSASYLELWVKVDSPVELHIDAGQVDEDATNNNSLDTESSTGILGNDQDVGFWTPQSLGAHDTGAYPNPVENPSAYPDLNYWGKGNKVVDTEDLDGNGQLDRVNKYYTFTKSLQGDPNNFQLIQIPLTSAGVVGTDLSVVPGNIAYYANIRALRVWIKSNGSTGGRLLIESIQFKGNKWQVRADPNVTTLAGISVTADTSRFQVNAINRITQPSVAPAFPYVPNTDFYNQDTNKSDDREQSLQLQYALTRLEQSDGKPFYQARRQLANGQDVDLGAYQKLRVDIYKPADTLPGERLLLRLGIDDQNYFEYQVALDTLSTGTWNDVILALDGSDGKRSVVGKPYLRQVRFVTLAVHTLNDNLNYNMPNNTELLWINNLRVTDAVQREGGAQRVGLTYDFMNGALVVSHDIREIDSDFVKMDQQAVDPQRHETSQVIDAKLNAVPGLPVSVRYEERDRFTEHERRDDPKYNRIFVDPDESNHKTTASVSFSKLPGLSLNASGSMEHSRQIFLPAYIDAQRNLALPIDKGIVPNTNNNNLHLSQDASYHFPDWFWGLRGDELKLEGAYDENKVIFDQESLSTTDLAFKNVERRSRTIKGRYNGTYKAGDWLTVTPSYAYTVVEAEGNIPIPTLLAGTAYYDLGPDRRSDGWVPQSRVINPSLQLQLKDTTLLRNPRVGYNFTQTRDYVRNELRTPGTVDLAASLNLAGLGEGWTKMPVVDLTQSFGVDSVVNNDPRVRGSDRQGKLDDWLSSNPDFQSRYAGVADQNLPSLALQEQQQPLDSVWWIRLGENPQDALNIENIATSASRRSTTSLSTRFDMPVLPNWTGTFTPRLSLRDERTMSAPEQILRTNQMTVGSGLEFQSPHIPWWELLKPATLTINYTYSSSDSYVVLFSREDLSSNTLSHEFTGTLPMRPTERMALTASLRWALGGRSNFTVGNPVPISKNGSWDLGPAFKLVYFLNIDKPWKMPDMWPFYGRELRIKQSFRLDNDLTLTMHRESQSATTNTLADSGSDTYGLVNQVGWDFLDNVKMKMTVDQRYFSSPYSGQAINRQGNYYSVTLKLGLEAVF